MDGGRQGGMQGMEGWMEGEARQSALLAGTGRSRAGRRVPSSRQDAGGSERMDAGGGGGHRHQAPRLVLPLRLRPLPAGGACQAGRLHACGRGAAAGVLPLAGPGVAQTEPPLVPLGNRNPPSVPTLRCPGARCGWSLQQRVVPDPYMRPEFYFLCSRTGACTWSLILPRYPARCTSLCELLEE